MQTYLQFLRDIVNKGDEKSDRTGVGTISTFGYQMRFDLQKGFPLVTTKKIHLKSVIYELLWFLRGDTNIQFLTDNNVSIWDAWADERGELGPVYGKQWRTWEARSGETVDQITRLIERIKTNPDSRRHIVTAWNPSDVDEMALPPCHLLFQFYVCDGRLSCQLYQRSADAFLGVPFNVSSYALLTYLIAKQCDLTPAEFIWTGGDCHVYLNHLEQVALQTSRTPYDPPTLNIKRRADSIFEYQYEDFEVLNYQCHPHIKGKVAV